jgi:hypothetical protein
MELNYIAALISLAFIIIVLYGPWQSLWTDWARQQLFEIRDGIFDMAVAGRISFEDENYRVIRESIQSGIRFAHGITWIRFSLWRSLASSNQALKPSRLKTAIDNIKDHNLRLDLHRLRRDMGLAYLVLMLVRSPTLLVFSFLILPIVLLKHHLDSGELGYMADHVQREAETGDEIAV